MSNAVAERRMDATVTAVLVALGAGAWYLSFASLRMDMSAMGGVSLAAFTAAWVAMMAAMMLPSLAPVVRLYRRVAATADLAPLPVFVGAYLAVWSVVGLAAYPLWRAVAMPAGDGETWAARVAGGILLVAAAYELTPVKSACLTRCTTPMSFVFESATLATPLGAIRSGVKNGWWCFACCWALMASLTALGAMSMALMVGAAAIIYVQKATRIGRRAAPYAAAALAALGLVVLVHPSTVMHFT